MTQEFKREPTLEQPCLGICDSHRNDDQICSGCGRHREDILYWGRLDQGQRKLAMKTAAKRREQRMNQNG